jgi:hypothetical protein
MTEHQSEDLRAHDSAGNLIGEIEIPKRRERIEFPDPWPERLVAAKPSPAEGSPRLASQFKRTNTNDLLAATFDPLKAIVPGYIYGGFTVLAGRQKLGKTWLAIDWAVAVATGGVALGSIDCTEGDVLYIDMENGPRRIQSRIRALFPYDQALPDMSRLEWVTDAPQLDQGFIDRLEQWRLSVSDPRLVVIDVLQRIKPAGHKSRNAYENDYSIWAPLQEWATRHGIAVVGLHHTKKGGADDPLEALSGSNGLSACADTTVLLDQDQNGRTLYVRGRDVEEKETAVRFLSGAWSIIGEAAEVRRSDERALIIATLQDHGEPMTPAEIVSATGRPRVNIQKLLGKMAKAAELFKVGRGRYWTEDTGNSGHTDHFDNSEPKTSNISEAGASPDVTIPEHAGHFEEDGLSKIPLSERDPATIPPYYISDVVSRRHKCAHCGERGETVEVRHGIFTSRAHRGKCAAARIANFQELDRDDEAAC